ncbi:MAG: acetyl-CoA carboxylase carboxyltransferase subunit beta [Actinobacteria bacterium]|nr:MAG: acetyl-CoA carboxylase carboxyltransferase subunit beta [Actinomycetota bacterium]
MSEPALSKKVEKSKVVVPEGLWTKCVSCRQIIYEKELIRNYQVCPKCGHHHYLPAISRIELLLDDASFKEINSDLKSGDPLNFKASKSYKMSLKEAGFATALNEAIITGEGKIDGKKVCLSVMDFKFIGGSMGSVVGEKVARAADFAINKKLPFIVVCASGGARMQEGMLSLMQMAKTSMAVGKIHENKLPFISIMAHPTTGGVLASFPSLADIIIAEPKALIGFTGARVIERTIKERLPDGFQTAEFLLKHGMVDLIASRAEQKEIVSQLLGFMGY